MEDIKIMPTIQILDSLVEAMRNNEQYLVNIYAYELACRLYVPNNDYKTFDELLEDFGYKKIKIKTL